MNRFLKLLNKRALGPVTDKSVTVYSYGFKHQATRYFILPILFCMYGWGNAAITTEVDPPKVQLGEPFRLSITMDDMQFEGLPNLTPLQQDFTISSTERSSSYTIVNGKARSVSQWSVLLLPKKTGLLSIPAIQFGKEQSTATTIEVTGEATTSDTNSPHTLDNEVMLKTAVSQENPFVNQQVIYTVKLYNSKRLLDAEYQPPRIENALIVPLGDGRRYQTVEEGRNYHVEEQQYAVFPQKSGEFEITSPTFNAIIYDVVPRRLNLRSQPTTLKVKSMPAHYTGNHWLPAKQVNLKEEYDKNNSSLLQGSTMERTVTLQTLAVPGELLPTLDFTSGKDFSAYAEKAIINNVIKQQEIMGTMTVKIIYVLNTAGQIIIPELKLPWFNTVTGKEEVAVLPARNIVVAPKANAPIANSESPTPTAAQISSDAPVENPVTSPVTDKSKLVACLVAIGFAVAWLLTLLVWFFSTGKFSRGDQRRALSNLKDACLENKPIAAHSALLRWAALHWPNEKLLNLNDVSKLVNDIKLKKHLHLLTEALYSEEKTKLWQGDELWRCVLHFRHRKSSLKNKGNGLPPINPN